MFFHLFFILYGFLGISACGLGRAYAVSDSHLQAARQAIVAIHATDQFDVFLPRTMLELKNELLRKDPNQEKMISQTVEEQAMRLVSRRANLEKEVTRIYAMHFTESELNDITKFYSSSVGKKLLEGGPKAMADSVDAFDIWRRGIAQDLAGNVSRELDEKLKINIKKK
ncbi:MAG: hypothetical protein JSC085_000132 [Candidatus Tokpelaia sp. JSC085]|nr:MAG: hypothetical protein JSC085_000132 [Candidatus Tokpelaia sp. JSC085]